ncbi:MAG: ATP-dependent helicase, partial [Deltaproteobacteria bacterium]|nr:ATP-dependent helicase [Deltaproteobacteria bacterium]
AGAGSGKTRALTYRVARLLETGTPPERILLLTFTNRAARDMMARVEAICRVDLRRMSGGTFHSVALHLLRDHAPKLGYADRFALLDREDSKELFDSATADLSLGVGQRRFPRADVLADLYSSAVNTQRSLSEVIQHDSPQFTAVEDGILAVSRRYAERKAAMNAMDFDDLLLNWKRLLVELPDACRSLQDRFSAVLVDEYQDTNKLQGDIVDLMAARHRHLLVVGDDAQSIYGFRGAHFENILKFPERWPETQRLMLTVNYRSSPQILALANASIARNQKQFKKVLTSWRDPGVLPALVPLRDVHQQAQFVAQRLLELREEGIPLKEQAVLYRAHHHSMEIQMELMRRGIPFRVRSGVRFFEQAHIKDVLAHLRFLQNPRDELSFKRVIKLAPGIGAASADALWSHLAEAARAGRDPRVELGKHDLDQLVPAKARSGLKRMRMCLAALAAPSMQSSPSEMITFILEDG